MLGAAWIAGRATIPAIQASANGHLVAIASRDAGRAAQLAARHGLKQVYGDYASLLADPAVDAVYLPLPNSLHLPWTQRALAAGKHVLCEKPLALNAAEADEMAEAARRAGRLLMEGLMFRYHPRIRQLVDSLRGARIRHVYAGFGFPIDAPDNYRMRPELGGGALLDVGCYCVSAARLLLGEPDRVEAIARREAIDMSWSAVMGFPGGALASIYASFESPEFQELVVVTEDEVRRVTTPFTAYRDPHDPYLLMVEDFAAAALGGGAPAIPLSESIANLRVLDRIRDAA